MPFIVFAAVRGFNFNQIPSAGPLFTCIQTRESRGNAREAAHVNAGPTTGSFPISRSD
jgi:hypothetical protein